MALPAVPGIALDRLLGTGGMGAVYAGVHDDTGRPAAVKILLTDSPSESARTRFEREARAMMQLSHPNLCSAWDFGVLEDGRLYLVLDLLVGEDLGARLDRDGVISATEAVRIGRETAAGLIAAHDAGLVHRDIKPSNIFLHEQDGEIVARILDFGLAFFGAHGALETRVTQTGEVLGTPAYMAPEQARGDKTEDERTDIYGLGAVLYRAIAGVPPFGGGSMLEVLVRVLTDEAQDLSTHIPELPAALNDAIMAAIDRDKLKRPRSMKAFDGMLEQAAAALENVDLPVAVPLDEGLEELPTLADENRILTVMLAGGVDDLDAVEAAIRKQGGRPTRVGGGSVLGLFGGDKKQGGEATRAVEAAVAVEAMCTVVGVGTGYAVGGRGHFSGEAVKAAEAATVAMSEGVVVDAETAKRVDSRFEVEDGRVVGVLDTAERRRPELPMLGREVELGEVCGHIRRAFDEEEPVAILITGPPGIGRSRLLDEAIEASDGDEVRRIETRCDLHHRFSSWWLMAALLRGWADLTEDTPAEEVTAAMVELAERHDLSRDAGHLLCTVLGIKVGSDISPALHAVRQEPQAMRDQIVTALGDLIEAEAETRPILISIDDVQWADAVSLSALSVVLGRVEFGRLAFVFAGRESVRTDHPELFGGPDLRLVVLRELSRKAAVRLAMEAGLSAPVAEQIVIHTGGNPLFVEQIALATSGGDFDGSSTQTFHLPLTVEEAIQTRLDHLEAGDKDAVKMASVFGVRFWREALEAMGSTDPGVIKRLRRRRLVVPARRVGHEVKGAEAFDFRAGVIRDVAYGMLTNRQRKLLHMRAARWMQRSGIGETAEIADHLARGGDPEGATPLWMEAARAARDAGDLNTALDRLERALEAAGPHEVEIRLMRLDMGASSGELSVADEEDTTIRTFENSLEEAQKAQLYHARGAAAIWRAEYERADELLGKAIELYEQHRLDRGLGRALASRALVKCQGRLGPARAWAERAFDVLKGDPMGRARALQALHYVAVYEGGETDVRASAIEALEACQEAGDLRRAVELGVSLAYVDAQAGRFPEAEERLRDIVSRSDKIGNKSAKGYALHNLGHVLWRTRRSTEGLEAQTKALDLARRLDHGRLVIGALTYCALVLLDLDRADEAVEQAAEAVELSIGDAEEGIARTSLAISLHQAGRSAEAATEIHRARALRDQSGRMAELELDMLYWQSQIAATLGDLDESKAALEEAKGVLWRRADELAATPEERTRFLASSPIHRKIHDATMVDPR